MIERNVITDCAEKAGFGGVSRNMLYTRLAKFAEEIAAWNTQRNSRTCEEIGNRFRHKETEFTDGQMDGAYQCAEVLAKNR